MTTLLWVVILVSISLGSFANNVISYFVNNSSFDLIRSTCYCGKKYLNMVTLIPILNYFLSKGKCSYCGEKLTVRYLLVEVSCLLIGIACYLSFASLSLILISTALFTTLFCIGIIDYLSYKIPDILTILTMFQLVLLSIFYENLSVINLIPAVLIPALLILANSVSIKIRDISVIGYGDIKLVAVLMLFINVPLSLIALWFSSLIAIPGFYLLKITSKRISEANKVPYGFFISISYILIILFKSQVTNTYLSFIGIEV